MTSQYEQYRSGRPRVNNIRPNARRDMEGITIIDRDPCFRCGVRADIGCGHQSASEAIAFPSTYEKKP